MNRFIEKYKEREWKKLVKVAASRLFPIAYFYLRQLGFKKDDDLVGRIIVDRERKVLILEIKKREERESKCVSQKKE